MKNVERTNISPWERGTHSIGPQNINQTAEIVDEVPLKSHEKRDASSNVR